MISLRNNIYHKIQNYYILWILPENYNYENIIFNNKLNSDRFINKFIII